MIYIYQNLGLGDHIVCNGIIREYSKKYDKIGLFCKDIYYESINYMYRDLNNVKVLPMLNSDNGIFEYIKNNNIDWYNEVIKIGSFGNNWGNDNITFDERFYLQAEIKFENRWKSFFIKRDLEKEKLLFKKLNIAKPYIVIHEDIERNYIINNNLIHHNNIIRIDTKLTNNIFEYIKLFENAEEIHLVESCFLFLIDSIEFNKNIKLFNHRYARKYSWISKPHLKKNWNIYEV